MRRACSPPNWKIENRRPIDPRPEPSQTPAAPVRIFDLNPGYPLLSAAATRNGSSLARRVFGLSGRPTKFPESSLAGRPCISQKGDGRLKAASGRRWLSDRHNQLLPPRRRGAVAFPQLRAACNVNPAGRPARRAASTGGSPESQRAASKR
jgi:hypothetical protein